MALATLLQAGQKQDLSVFQIQAKRFLESRLSEQFQGKIVVHIEQRQMHKITPCEKAVSFFLPSTVLQNQMSVGMRCENTLKQGWTLFIPATVQLKKRVVVAKRDLPQGVSIQMNDIILQERDIIPLRQGYFETLEAVLGQTTQITVAADMPVPPSALRTRTSIKRGQAFRVVA